MITKRYRRCSRLLYYLIICIAMGIVLNLTVNLYRSSFRKSVSSYVTVIPKKLPLLGNTTQLSGGLQHESSTTENYEQGNGTRFRFNKFSRHSEFLVQLENRTCFIEGTDLARISSGSCYCKAGWHGASCSIPDIVFNSDTPWKKESLVLRRNPRRIIQAFPFNMEFELLEIRFAEIFDVVDVFIILESNFTAYGTQKDLHFLKRLQSNVYPNEAHKIVHVFLDYFPQNARQDGWIADGLLRNYIGTEGLNRIQGWEMNDLFVLTDADELPTREALVFLKWHDGYTEPVSFVIRWSVYGFFWSPNYQEPGMPKSERFSVCVTMGMLVYVFRYQVYHIRSANQFLTKHDLDVKLYVDMGGRVNQWTLGTDKQTAGWHCSWCLDPDRILNKLVSAQNGDFPRWGDFPEKRNISYIKSLVGKGMWFDDRTSMVQVNASRFAPKSLLEKQERYSHLIKNIYADNN